MNIKEIKDEISRDHGWRDWDMAYNAYKNGVMSQNSWDDLMGDITDEVNLQYDINETINISTDNAH